VDGVPLAEGYEAEYGDMANVFHAKDDTTAIAYQGTGATNMGFV
jgi:hypothetical protein